MKGKWVGRIGRIGVVRRGKEGGEGLGKSWNEKKKTRKAKWGEGDGSMFLFDCTSF